MAIGEVLAGITGNNAFMSEAARFKRIDIEDIPMLLCQDGSICCIPKTPEAKAIAFVGNSGMGKTLLMNRLHSYLYYHWKDNVAIMNDVSEETYYWSDPMKNKEFNLSNSLHLNQTPLGSPIVYLYPNTATLNFDYKKLENKSYLKMVLPFAEVLDNLSFYLAAVNPEFELGKSGMYINDLKEGLLECDTPAQVKNFLENNLPGGDGKSFEAMRLKIITAFDSLMREQILDITNPECHSYLMFGDNFKDNPFITIMKARRIPALVTSDLITKQYKAHFFAHYINSIFENAPKIFPDKKTFLMFDELRDVCISDNDPAAQAIGRICSRGRIRNIGLIYATQYYNKIPAVVKGAKLNYMFAFKHGDENIVDEIKGDFNFGKSIKERIMTLRPFECIALTQDHFVFYRGDEKWTSSDPVMGRIFFPLADHKQGGVK